MSRRSEQRRLQAALDALVSAGSGDERRGSGGDVEDLAERVVMAAERVSDRMTDVASVCTRLSRALESVGEGVVVCDEDGEVVYRNAQAVTLAGAHAGDVVVARAVEDALAEALGGGRPEHILELFSPTRRNLVIRATELAGPDGGLGAVAVVEDVSERRRLEAVRRDFVANVSHELKTPVGALSLLAETLDGEDDPEVVARLSSRVSTEAARLGRIIDDLLDLSRIEVNDSPTREPVSLRRLVRDAVEPLRRMAERRQIKIDVTGTYGDATVVGNERDLVSAISNLVENAVKYSEDHSLVRVRAERRGDRAVVAVSDEGVGIPRRDLERIFERFYRVDRARSRSTGGTGLGLSIVRHVAANHGGRVEVESVEGEGSTFVLDLPAAPEDSEAPADG